METEYDMTHAKRGAVVSAAGKTRITIYLDDSVVEEFRRRAEQAGKGYQTLINETLATALAKDEMPVTVNALRQILREELHAA